LATDAPLVEYIDYRKRVQGTGKSKLAEALAKLISGPIVEKKRIAEATPAERAAAQVVVDAFDVAAEEQKLVDAENTKANARARARANPAFKDLVDAGLL